MSTMSLDITTVRPHRVLRWSRVRQRVAEWRRRARSRHELRTLDYGSLQDIGISGATADFESSKPFWQA
jgi:uncharacterized protein YjiS (DUF1127 family)